MSHIAPAFRLSAFNCPQCNAFAHAQWFQLHFNAGGWHPCDAHAALCSHCKTLSFWLAGPGPTGSNSASGKMIYPSIKNAVLPHPDMPAEIRLDYEEARNIAQESPRGSAALLRLCIQKLCQHLGESGKKINEDIGALVQKGLPVEIQQALDIVRVVGNNAVHPGELSNDDLSDVSEKLFELVNYIVEDRIAKPKKLSALFRNLPQDALTGIANRDGNKQQ